MAVGEDQIDCAFLSAEGRKVESSQMTVQPIDLRNSSSLTVKGCMKLS